MMFYLLNCSGSSHDRSKSASQSPSKSTVPAAAQQAPLYHSPVDHHLPITTNSVHTSAESHLSSTRASTDWYILYSRGYDNGQSSDIFQPTSAFKT